MAEAKPASTHPPTPPTEEEDRLDQLRLLRSRRVGIATYRRLMAEHGTAGAALAVLPGIARAAGISGYEPCSRHVAEAELRAGHRAGARLLITGERAYPAALAGVADAPPMIWVRGRIEILHRPMIAIVGARNASSLGVRMARQLAAALGRAGWTVVSGLARGIDTAAHEAALNSGTVAVMAGGIDLPYPPENAGLFDRIAQDGVICAEMPPGTVPQARHFPNRNRIVSALSQAVIVVEAATRSGSLITARHALDQGREVMAVPGHPFDPRAGGCNILLREGAVLVRDADDVIEALGPAPGPAPGPVPGPIPRPIPRPIPERDRPSGWDHGPDRLPPLHAGETGIADGPGASHTVPDSAPPAAPARSSRQPLAMRPPGSTPNPRPDPARDAPSPSDLLARLVLDQLCTAPLSEDQLIRDLDLPPQTLLPVLLDLELAGQILRAPSGLIRTA